MQRQREDPRRLDELRAAREQASKRILERIDGDRAAASSRIEPILTAIRARLFEPDLCYEALRRQLGIRDHVRASEFKRHTGLPPALYVRFRRMETAEALLVETDVPVADVATLVGYETAPSFSAVFRKHYELTPSAYRRAARGGPAATGGEPASRPTALWRRLIGEHLDSGEAGEVVRILLERHPEAGLAVTELGLEASMAGSKTGGGADADMERAERLMARVVWSYLAEEPWPRQEELIRGQSWLLHPALFWHLGERYVEASERDPAAGVRVARLAIEVAIGLGKAPDDDGTCELQALGWAWLGHAKQLARDLSGARSAFRAARARLPDTASARVLGEIDFHESTLLCHEGHYPEAAALAANARHQLRGHGDGRLYVRCLHLFAAIEMHRGATPTALVPLREAARLAEAAGDAELEVTSYGNLLAALVELEQPSAPRILAILQRLLSASPHPALAARLRWLEGLVTLQRGDPARAAAILATAREAILAVTRRPDLVALLDLDVAQAELGRGRAQAALDAVLGALPALAEIRASGRLRSALAALRDGCETAVLDAERLRGVRAAMTAWRWASASA